MILKEQEDRDGDLDFLAGLLSRPALSGAQRRRIESEIQRIRAGDLGERTAAWELKVHYGPSPNWVVLNDLRIEHDGLVAQIDHLMINRVLDVWLLESKSVRNGVTINEQGEFSTWRDRRPVGMASPIEQNAKHIRVLKLALDAGRVQFPQRLGVTLKPRLRSLVLIADGIIKRPTTPVPGIETVIRVEHLSRQLQAEAENARARDIARLVGSDTLEGLGRQFLAMHVPIRLDWERRLGLGADVPEPVQPVASEPPARNCAACSVPVSAGIADYCRVNARRFGGAVLCMACQRMPGRGTSAPRQP